MRTLFFCLYLSVFISSCHQKEEYAGNKSLLLPEKMEVYYPSGEKSVKVMEEKPRYKIYTTIDVSCSTCLLKFKSWDEYYEEIRQYNTVELIPICSSKDNFELLKYWLENDKIYKISVPVLLDTESKFKTLNSVIFEDSRDIAVLTDADYQILFVGDPLEDEKDKKIFLKYITKK